LVLFDAHQMPPLSFYKLIKLRCRCDVAAHPMGDGVYFRALIGADN